MPEVLKKSILLVDDEAIIAMMEKQQLEREGYNVIYATNGEEAINIVRSGSAPVDLILMDIDLGHGIDGTEAASEILKDHDIPVVFLSSHREKDIVRRTEKITSYGYVVKNSGIMVLDASIKMAFRLFNSRMKEKEKKAALRESREIFRDLSDKAMVGIYFIQDGKFLYANATLAGILGYGIRVIVNRMGPADVVFQEDWSLVEENIARRLSGEEQSNRYEFRVITKNGEIRDVEVYSSRTIFNGMPAIIGTLVDITERKHAENELKRINEILQLITENMSEGVVLSDMSMKIKYITPSVTRRHGYTVEELNSIPAEKRMSEESFARFIEMAAEELKPENLADPGLDITRVIELEYLRKDGTSCWSESSFRLIRDAEGRPAGILGVGRDITERKLAEEKLHLHTLAMEAAIEGIAILDAAENYVYLNRAHAEIYGYSAPGELAGKSWRILYDADELARFDSEIMPRLKKNGFFRGTATGRKKDGSLFSQELSLTTLDNGGLICIVRDISERQEVERALRESEEKYRLLINHASDLIWSLTPGGVLSYLSPSWKKVLGYDPDTLTGSLFHPIIHPDDLPVCLDTLNAAISTNEVTHLPEYRVLHADGTWRWHTASGTPVLGDDRKLISFVGISRDITEKKLADDRIMELLREKELILKEVHHRVKNNMNTIFGLLVLQAEAQKDTGAKNILLDSAGRVQSMMVLYDKLYRSEINTSVPVKSYFPALMNEIAAIFPHIGDVLIKTDVDDFILRADVLSTLGIIINELVTNAMKYAFTGRPGGEICMKVSKTRNLIKIVFEDDGAGIPESVSFETSSGFGLQLIKMLVKQLKGSVRIERDRGTRFIIDFED